MLMTDLLGCLTDLLELLFPDPFRQPISLSRPAIERALVAAQSCHVGWPFRLDDRARPPDPGRPGCAGHAPGARSTAPRASAA